MVKNRKGVAARLAASVLSWSCTPNERRLVLLKVACKVVDTNARICSIARSLASYNPICYNPRLNHHQITPAHIGMIKTPCDFEAAIGMHDAEVLSGDECA